MCAIERGFIPQEQHELMLVQLRMAVGRMKLLESRMSRMHSMIERMRRGVPIDELEWEMVDKWFNNRVKPR